MELTRRERQFYKPKMSLSTPRQAQFLVRAEIVISYCRRSRKPRVNHMKVKSGWLTNPVRQGFPR